MLVKLPKLGDLLHSLKEWSWTKEVVPITNQDQISVQLFRFIQRRPEGPVISYRPSIANSFMVSSFLPTDVPLFVLSFEGTTLRIFWNGDVFHVTAECIEHILNDFELLSAIKEVPVEELYASET